VVFQEGQKENKGPGGFERGRSSEKVGWKE